MSAKLESEFLKVLYSLDENQVLAFFRDMEEEKRRSLAPLIIKLGEDAYHRSTLIPEEAIPELHDLVDRTAAGEPFIDMRKHREAYKLLEPKVEAFKLGTAIAGIATLLPVEYHIAYWIFPAFSYAEKILIERNPPWINALFTTQNDVLQSNAWIHLYYKFFKKGHCQRRLDDEMITIIVHALPNNHDYSATNTIREDLLAMPEFLETEIWLIFELPPDAAPLREEQYSHRPHWKTAFTELANNNEIDRTRLFQALVDMLNRGMNEPAIKWCVGVFKDCKPTDKETAAVFDGFPSLLDSKQPPVYTFACDMLLKISKKDSSFDAKLLEPIEKMLRDKSKTRAKQCLSLVELILKRSPQFYDKIFSLLFVGLHHEVAEIQSTALKLIQKHRKSDDLQTIERLFETASSLAPSVRKELNLETAVPQKERTKTNEITKNAMPERTSNRLAHIRKLEPIQTVEELVDLALKIIQDPTSCDEHELLLDGLDRLHDKKDASFQKTISPIRKILLGNPSPTGIFPLYCWAGKYFDDEEPVEIDNYGYYLAAIIALWIADERDMSPDGSMLYATFDGCRSALNFIGYARLETLFANRITHLARRMCSGITHQAMSAPTHTGGWIDPVVFVQPILVDTPDLAPHDRKDKIHRV